MDSVVGLTGGIASGKSAVSAIFESLGASIVDTDVLAAELTSAGTEAMAEIQVRLGAEYLREDGSLDRVRTRELVFRDRAAKSDLEAILHPRIRARVLECVGTSVAPLTVVVVPLMFETMAYRHVISRVIVVDADEALQFSRLCSRPGMTASVARAILSVQVPRPVRLQLADAVLSNNSSPEALRGQVSKEFLRWAVKTSAQAQAKADVCQMPTHGRESPETQDSP